MNDNSLLMSAPAAARYLGLNYESLIHATAGTLCLNEYRRKAGRAVLFIRAQVEVHGAQVILNGQCDGGCRRAAEAAISQARETIAKGKAA